MDSTEDVFFLKIFKLFQKCLNKTSCKSPYYEGVLLWCQEYRKNRFWSWNLQGKHSAKLRMNCLLLKARSNQRTIEYYQARTVEKSAKTACLPCRSDLHEERFAVTNADKIGSKDIIKSKELNIRWPVSIAATLLIPITANKSIAHTNAISSPDIIFTMLRRHFCETYILISSEGLYAICIKWRLPWIIMNI